MELYLSALALSLDSLGDLRLRPLRESLSGESLLDICLETA